jgi:predicted nucleic acid-binding protein
LTAVVVDSSVAVKWFVPEALSDVAARLLEPTYDLTAPDLLVPEFGNVLWKKLRRNQLLRDEALEIVAGLGEVPLTIVASAELVAPAIEIAAAYGRTVYEALYVALAVARDCVLVTADERLVAALAGGPFARHVGALASMA